MAKPDDKKARSSDADKLKVLKKKLKKLKNSVREAAANLETRAEEVVATVAVKAVKATKLVSPLAPARFPDLPVIEGAEFSSGAAKAELRSGWRVGTTAITLLRSHVR